MTYLKTLYGFSHHRCLKKIGKVFVKNAPVGDRLHDSLKAPSAPLWEFYFIREKRRTRLPNLRCNENEDPLYTPRQK